MATPINAFKGELEGYFSAQGKRARVVCRTNPDFVTFRFRELRFGVRDSHKDMSVLVWFNGNDIRPNNTFLVIAYPHNRVDQLPWESGSVGTDALIDLETIPADFRFAGVDDLKQSYQRLFG